MADPPFFFLSYARSDRERDGKRVIERFYDDLCEELAPSLGPMPQIGFLDSRDIETGAGWSDELSAALATCQLFVPVLSRNYFSRYYCGVEWSYFRLRLDAATRARGKPSRLIQPVMLVGPHRIKPVPAAVDSLQNRTDAFPTDYSTQGLRSLQLNASPEAYRAFVTAFANRLLDEVDLPGLAAGAPARWLPPADGLPRLADVPSAFHASGTLVVQTTDDAAAALHFAQFVYVAGRRDELEGVRRDVRCYGREDGAEWQPYMPKEPQPVGIMATAVTSQEEFIYESLALDESLVTRLEEARRRSKVAVVIVDAWTVKLPAYRQILDELDRYNLPNTVVVVPSNPHDPESRRAVDLHHDVTRAFSNRIAAGSPDQFVTGLSTSSEFKSELASKLCAARERVRRQLAVTRRATGEGPTSLPVLGRQGG